MKIYLDDEREAPEGWTRTRSSPVTIALLRTEHVTHLSLDHDLGEEDGVGNGYDVLLWIEEQVACYGYSPVENITVHSANSGARPKMLQAIEAIKRLVGK